jgi:hypothetical protein
MQYKGTQIHEEQHLGRGGGGHVILTATVARQLSPEEVDKLRGAGHENIDGTVSRDLEVTAGRRQEAFQQMKEKIDEYRKLGYR